MSTVDSSSTAPEQANGGVTKSTAARGSRAYSYIRFSTPEQAKGAMLERQAAVVKSWSERDGVDSDAELDLIDHGISAWPGAIRACGEPFGDGSASEPKRPSGTKINLHGHHEVPPLRRHGHEDRQGGLDFFELQGGTNISDANAEETDLFSLATLTHIANAYHLHASLRALIPIGSRTRAAQFVLIPLSFREKRCQPLFGGTRQPTDRPQQIDKKGGGFSNYSLSCERTS
jgi:hypothetical protein